MNLLRIFAKTGQSNLVLVLVLVLESKRPYYMTSSVSKQDEPNRALWLATRAGKMELSWPLGISRLVPQEQRSFFGVLSHILGFDMTSRPPCWCPDQIFREFNSIIMQTLPFVFVEKHGCWSREWKPATINPLIDQACLVKMAGYCPHPFFACLWTSTSSRSINTQKKNIQPSYSEDTRTMNTCYFFVHFLLTIECGFVLLTRVFSVFTLTKCYTCNTIHHRKSLHFFVVEKNNVLKNVKCSRFKCPYCNLTLGQ